MLLLFLPEYFEMFCIYYLYCSCKINPLTHFIFLIFHFLFLSETEGHHNRLRKADCARTNQWGCRISKYFCWAAALLSAQNGIEISYGSDAIL